MARRLGQGVFSHLSVLRRQRSIQWGFGILLDGAVELRSVRQSRPPAASLLALRRSYSSQRVALTARRVFEWGFSLCHQVREAKLGSGLIALALVAGLASQRQV